MDCAGYIILLIWLVVLAADSELLKTDTESQKWILFLNQ